MAGNVGLCGSQAVQSPPSIPRALSPSHYRQMAAVVQGEGCLKKHNCLRVHSGPEIFLANKFRQLCHICRDFLLFFAESFQRCEIKRFQLGLALYGAGSQQKTCLLQEVVLPTFRRRSKLYYRYLLCGRNSSSWAGNRGSFRRPSYADCFCKRHAGEKNSPSVFLGVRAHFP
jgi:hypothetical protein